MNKSEFANIKLFYNFPFFLFEGHILKITSPFIKKKGLKFPWDPKLEALPVVQRIHWADGVRAPADPRLVSPPTSKFVYETEWSWVEEEPSGDANGVVEPCWCCLIWWRSLLFLMSAVALKFVNDDSTWDGEAKNLYTVEAFFKIFQSLTMKISPSSTSLKSSTRPLRDKTFFARHLRMNPSASYNLDNDTCSKPWQWNLLKTVIIKPVQHLDYKFRVLGVFYF
jgi:hypothetical protein